MPFFLFPQLVISAAVSVGDMDGYQDGEESNDGESDCPPPGQAVR
jgi:hypothetical protein